MSHNGHLGATERRVPRFDHSEARLKDVARDYPIPPPIRLLSNQVLIRLIAPERISHGLWIPETAKRETFEQWQAEVVAVGPGARGKIKQEPNEVANPTPIYRSTITPCDVKPGDRVLVYWLGGRVCPSWPTDEYKVVPEDMIQLVLN